MVTAIWVAVGGAVGSLARYGLAGVVNARAHPLGTVTVNVVGSLAIGLLVGYWGFHVDSPFRIAISIGLLGGFTTFSTFAIDAIYLWEKGETNIAVASVIVSVLVGLGAAVVGLVIGRAVAG
jgi:CrcB protein